MLSPLNSKCQRQTCPKKVLLNTSCTVGQSNAADSEPAMLAVINTPAALAPSWDSMICITSRMAVPAVIL